MSYIVEAIVIINCIASLYGPGVMDRVIKTRQQCRTAYHLPKKIPVVDGYVASSQCDEIGNIVYLKRHDGDGWEKFLVTDCAGSDGTYQWMKRNNICYEVDWETAVRWGYTWGGHPVAERKIIKISLYNELGIYPR